MVIENKVFELAQVDSIIIQSNKPLKAENPKYQTYEYVDQLFRFISETAIDVISKSKEVIFRIFVNDELDNLILKIQDNTYKTYQIGEVKDGIVAGAIKDVLFMNKAIDSNSHKLYFGKNISRYYLSNMDIWVNYNPDTMMKEEIKRQGEKRPGLWMRDQDIFEREKIIYRKVGKGIIATLDDKGIYYEQTVHSATVTDKRFSTKYILALFNSTLFDFYYKKTNSSSGNIFPQVRISSIENLPIKLCKEELQAPIIELVDRILAVKRANPLVDTKNLEHEIDQLVYKLYGLTDEEIKIVEGK